MKPLIPFAKNLRKNTTDTERHLWRHLRAKRFAGLKFRRQAPIGPYIVDFVCHEKRLVIECDGGQHASQVDQDQKRDRWLVIQGFKVLRFWDHEVLQNTEAILESIWTACHPDHPPLSPLPSKGGEGPRDP